MSLKFLKEYNNYKPLNLNSELAQKIVDFLYELRLGDERDIVTFGDFNDYNFIIDNKYKILGFFEGNDPKNPKDWGVLIIDTHQPDWEYSSSDYEVKLTRFDDNQLKQIYENLPKYINYTQDVVFKKINKL